MSHPNPSPRGPGTCANSRRSRSPRRPLRPSGRLSACTVLHNGTPGDLKGAAWGGVGRIWLAPRLGLQLQITTSSSTVGGGATPGGDFPGTAARVFTASAQGVCALLAAPRSITLWLSAGAGLVGHGGAAYARYGSPVQLATVLGFGSAVPMGSHLIANVGVSTFLYNIDVSDSTGTSLEHGFQVDPVLHAGLGVRWP
jgi:hypothetical protein